MASPYRSLYTTLRKPLQALSPIATIAVCYIPSMRLASSAPGPSRRQITVTNDDGRIRWGELTMREKAARSTQQSVNVATIIVGFVLTGAVATLLYTEVFAVESKTNHYIRAVNQVKRDPRCIALLGRSKEIISYGEPTWNKWRRARPIASTIQKDSNGTENLLMHFNVEGPENKGVVSLHMLRYAGETEFHYKFLYLDVPGHERIFLENTNSATKNPPKPKSTFFGVRWTR